MGNRLVSVDGVFGRRLAPPQGTGTGVGWPQRGHHSAGTLHYWHLSPRLVCGCPMSACFERSHFRGWIGANHPRGPFNRFLACSPRVPFHGPVSNFSHFSTPTQFLVVSRPWSCDWILFLTRPGIGLLLVRCSLITADPECWRNPSWISGCGLAASHACGGK